MKDLATPSFWRRLGRSFRHEVDEDDGHGRRSSLFRRDPARRSFRGLFKRKDIEYDATIDGATHSTRKSLLERWLREDDPWRRESTCRLSPVELEKPAWISRCSAVQVVMCSEQPVMDGDDDDNDDATTQASDESPVTSPKQAARSNSAVLFKPTSYSYSYAFSQSAAARSSEYAAPLRLTSVPVAIPLIFRKRDRFYVGGKNIPFTRQNHLDRRQKHMRKAMDVVYEDCLYLDFALDPTVKNLVDYSRLLQHQRALAQAFLHAS